MNNIVNISYKPIANILKKDLPVKSFFSPKTLENDNLKTISTAIVSIGLATLALNRNREKEVKEKNLDTKIDLSINRKEIKAQIRRLCVGYPPESVENLISKFDYENAEIHLKNIERFLSSKNRNLYTLTDNGYFSSIEGADAYNYLLQITKTSDSEILNEFGVQLTENISVENISNIKSFIAATNEKNIAKNVKGVKKLISVGQLTAEEFKRFEDSKFCSPNPYISTIPELNQLLYKFKDEKADYLRLLDETLVECYQKAEDKKLFIDALQHIITSRKQHLRDLYLFLNMHDGKELTAYQKAYKYTKEQGYENYRIILDNGNVDLFKPYKSYDTRNGIDLYFDIDGNWTRSVLTSKNINSIDQRVITPNGLQIYSIDSITGARKLKVYDSSESMIYSELRERSRDNAYKHNVFKTVPIMTAKDPKLVNTKFKYPINLVEILPDGTRVEKSTTENIDGSKIQYSYIKKPDGSRSTNIKFKDSNGNVTLQNSYQYKVIDDSHFETIENGVKYNIVYLYDKVLVMRDDGESVSIEIGGNEENSSGILSRNILPLIKQLPGSAYFAIDKFGLKKIGELIDYDVTIGSHFARDKNIISIKDSDKYSIFVLLHEFGHYLDFNFLKLRINNELKEIYEKEVVNFTENHANIETQEMSYLIEKANSGEAIREMIADLYASRFAFVDDIELEERVALAKANFPKTFKFITEYLKKELL